MYVKVESLCAKINPNPVCKRFLHRVASRHGSVSWKLCRWRGEATSGAGSPLVAAGASAEEGASRKEQLQGVVKSPPYCTGPFCWR